MRSSQNNFSKNLNKQNKQFEDLEMSRCQIASLKDI